MLAARLADVHGPLHPPFPIEFMRNNSLPLRVAAGAAALSPFLMLTLQGGTGYCYFVALAASLIWLCHAPNRQAALRVLITYKWYVAAMAVYPLLIALQQLISGDFLGRAMDAPSRLLLVIPIFALLSQVSARHLRPFQWGCVAGAIGAALWSVYVLLWPESWVLSGRAGNPFTNPIPFGDTALVLGFMGAIPLAEGDRSRTEKTLRVIGLVAGCFAAYESESRGGWLAIPILLWVMVNRFTMAHRQPRAAVIGFLVATLIGLGAAATTPVVQTRLAAATSDIEKLMDGDADTSVGLRVQLWTASWQLFTEQPAFGVGKGRLESSLRELAGEGRASYAIVHPHAHNEIFSTMAEMGVLGLAALFLLYAGSGLYFWRYRRDADPDTATAAGMGLVLVFGTLIFGFTIDVFSLVMNTAFYALTTATLMGIIANRQGAVAGRAAVPGVSSARLSR